jgi:hypothetical protein
MTIAFVIMSMIAGLAIAAYILEVRAHRETINVAAEDSNNSYNMIIDLVQKNTKQDEHIAAIEQGRDEETECYEAQYSARAQQRPPVGHDRPRHHMPSRRLGEGPNTVLDRERHPGHGQHAGVQLGDVVHGVIRKTSP